jgi:hypothetical protein
MEKKLLVVLVVVGLCSTAALALDPMGPPTAGLKQGQWSAGLDYAYSEGDFKHKGDYTWAIDFDDDGVYDDAYDTIKEKFELKDGKMHKAYFNLGYGIMDNVEAFVRLGGASREIKRAAHEGPSGPVADTLFDSDTGIAIGFGGKATVWEPSPELKVGVLAQASYSSAEYSVTYSGQDWIVPTEGDIDFWEMQFALGATYKLSDKFSVYGGPFYYIFDGNYDFKGSGIYDDYSMNLKGSYDIEQGSEFGGYLGAQIAVTENVAVNAECQATSDAIAFGTGLVWKF